MISKFNPYHIHINVESAPEGNFGMFVPGQTVSGKAIYSPPCQVDIEMVDIVFKGKCFTRINEHRNNGTTSHTAHYPEKVVLFRLTEQAFRGPNTLQAGRYEWPFSFKIPLEATYHRKQQSGDAKFEMVPTQPLPPSFNLKSETHSYPPDVKISYEIKVKINPGRTLHKAELVSEVPVWPFSKTPLQTPKSIKGYCSGDGRFKSNKLRPTKHTFKEKMGHVFTSNPSLRTPEINIEVYLEMPRSVGISQPMPLRVSSRYIKKGETDPEKPNLILFDCHISLKTYVFARAKGTISDHSKDGKQTACTFNIPGNKLQMPLDGSFVTVTESFRLADMKGQTEKLIPNFKNWIVDVSHKMTVKVRVQHPETLHVWSLESKFPFEILADHVASPAYEGKQSIAQIESGQYSLADGAASSSRALPEFNDDPAPPLYNSADVWSTDRKIVQ